MKYYKRYIDLMLKEYLKSSGAVYLRGPKWVGKTTSCMQIAKSIIKIDDPIFRDNNISIAKINPTILLSGEKPLLLDEWQIAPQLWNAVRFQVDKLGEVGLFILTGSATPIIDDSHHSGVGRIANLTMLPMSLYESHDSTGEISILELKKGNYKITRRIESKQQSIDEISYLICRGGWPAFTALTPNQSLCIARRYIESIIDIEFKNLGKNNKLAEMILRNYALNISSTTPNTRIYEDIKAVYGEVSDKTINDYLTIFEQMFIIDSIPGWNISIRSKTAIQSSPKKDFVDPSLAAAILNLSPQLLYNDMAYFGLLFESLVRRDLKVYSMPLGGYLRHYRDRYGLECDNVLFFNDGSYGLIEVKLGHNDINKAVANLRKLRTILVEKEKKPPQFLMIIVGIGVAYQLEDDILIVPIGVLCA